MKNTENYPVPESPYRGNPRRTYWKTGMRTSSVATIPDLYTKRFDIKESDRIATAGSCFAQHIARYMRSNGYSVLDVEPAPPNLTESGAAEHGYGIYSARYGNIYYTRQLSQLVREAIGERQPKEIVWERDGRFYDALRPSIFPGGHESPELVLAHRKSHLSAVVDLLTQANVFVFTMGLTEGWVSKSDGTVYPTAPGTVAGSFDSEKYEFQNFNYAEVVRDFLEFRIMARRINPRIKFILTVSPVPLAATATESHVLTATTYSKAVLRAAAGEIIRRCADVDYFPSYEVISASYVENSPFDKTGRNVLPEAVEKVMNYFFAEHKPVSNISSRQLQDHVADEQVFCDDALLEMFAK
ncbi:GSCFA domain-containing protein [Glutamicibacter ardleyensis]|uniref:GSCFA domain-containing protein n=1 Tax=Glutamicibacter ardleyensis TaxID=225894 RepID=UPI003FD13C43